MKTIAIISQKGGAGKTTLALHLATAFSSGGLNAAIIDLDPQASAAKWSDRRELELPVVISAHASRLSHELGRIEEFGGELAILDTAPHSDSAALEAAKLANLVLIPCRPAILDLDAIANTLDLVRAVNEKVLVIMNAVAPKGGETAEAIKAIEELNVSVCPVHLINRVAFARALITGQTAVEFEPDGKAAMEAERMHTFIRAHLNIGDDIRGVA